VTSTPPPLAAYPPPRSAGGAPFAPPPNAPSGYGYPGPAAAAGYGPSDPTPTPATREVDRTALTYVEWAAVLALIPAVIGVVSLAVPGSFYRLQTTPAGGSTFTFGAATYAYIAVEAGLELLLSFLLLLAFRRLRTVDSRFGTPATLVWLLVIGIVVVWAGLFVVLAGLSSLHPCNALGSSPATPTSCGVGNGLLAGLVVVGIAGVLALVGFIALLIGIWRLGSRFRGDLFKVGAILLIFPVLNFVGAILILVEARRARSALPNPGAVGMVSF
jgi:hypothetical protein